MDNVTNTEIVQGVYRDFGAGNIQAVMSYFDKDIIWERPGLPAIPFSGTFKGLEGMAKMFELVKQNIRLTSFTPQKFCSNVDTVVVLGTDSAEVIATGKSYSSAWVQSFTLRDKKIIHVQVYIDTLAIADSFLRG